MEGDNHAEWAIEEKGSARNASDSWDYGRACTGHVYLVERKRGGVGDGHRDTKAVGTGLSFCVDNGLQYLERRA